MTRSTLLYTTDILQIKESSHRQTIFSYRLLLSNIEGYAMAPRILDATWSRASATRPTPNSQSLEKVWTPNSMKISQLLSSQYCSTSLSYQQHSNSKFKRADFARAKLRAPAMAKTQNLHTIERALTRIQDASERFDYT